MNNIIKNIHKLESRSMHGQVDIVWKKAIDDYIELSNKKKLIDFTSTIFVTNIGGPLNHLDNKWFFNEIENSTEVIFEIDFEIKNKFLNIIMTKSFQFGLDKIADAFQKRAEELFNKS